METSTRPHHGREKDSASGTAVLMNIKGELFHTNYVKGLVKKYKGGGVGGPEHFEMWWLENT